MVMWRVRWRAFHVERGDPSSLVLASADEQRPSPCSIFQMARPATSSSITAWWRSREFANACSTWNEEAAHEVLLRGGWRPPLGMRTSRGR
ncbi:hypothetical protein MXAN_7482 [Myxococcus xanthus DK 1622]|uniref:Uncharacterized protein n=1 Tax=Myxococcus xanthus (strain DK1622) TaxID=246197 RepID=Q1CVI7_MYXXD|nr:hypothetical protein MXAN_7482 [Myxococcus xanthus DK 1622]